jgi:heme/copper-type cytochrome/quinol oxidase subunit 2
MKRDKILAKAQKYLIKYSNSTSKYYEELKKTYNEFKSLDDVDLVTIKLYGKQINKLCLFIEEKENFVSFLITLIMVIIVIIILISYTTITIFNRSDKVNVVIEKANSEVDLNVMSSDKVFELKYSDISNFKDLEPIIIELNPVSNNNYNIVYNIYLEVLNFTGNKDNLKYVISIDDNDYVYNLKDQSIVLNKYLIYTNSMKINDFKKIHLRLFDIDSNDDISTFEYKLSYDAYLE